MTNIATSSVRRLLAWGVMGAVCALWVGVPLWVVVVNSLKSEREAALLGIGLPTDWSALENYGTVIREGRLLQGLVNTLLYAGGSIFIILLLGTMAAWVLARSRSRWSQPLYYFAISGVFIPPAIVTTILVMKMLGIYGQQISIILYYSAVHIPLAVFLMTGFVKGIPVEIEEAARVDGAAPTRIFLTIILPLMRPTVSTCFVILFLLIWNDFISPFFFLSKTSQWPLTVGLYNFASGQQFTIRWNLVFAHVVLVSLPAVAVFLVAQRQLLTGLMDGSRK